MRIKYDLASGATTEEPLSADEIAQNAINAAAEIKTRRIRDIKAQLADIDMRSIRPVAEGDAAKLAELRTPVAGLRAELAALVG